MTEAAGLREGDTIHSTDSQGRPKTFLVVSKQWVRAITGCIITMMVALAVMCVVAYINYKANEIDTKARDAFFDTYRRREEVIKWQDQRLRVIEQKYGIVAGPLPDIEVHTGPEIPRPSPSPDK